MARPRPLLTFPPREIVRTFGWLLRDWLGSLGLTVAALRDENDRLREEVERLRHCETLAYHDALTGLRNRRFFDERVGEEIARAAREPSRMLSLLVIDIDEFKDVNDAHGHAAGDAVLRWLGRFLQETLRDFDVCCRIGGDEFAVILPDTSARAAHKVAARLTGRLASANRDRSLPVEVSVGVASAPEQARSAEDLLAAADAAMYRDKRRQESRRLLRVPARELRTA